MTAGGSGETPRISVVIPTLRRHGVLRQTLEGLERQDAPPETFEVVVVADAEEEDFEAVASDVAGRSYHAQALQSDVPGASAARNRGWRAARAPLVLFIDDDTLPSRSLVAQHLAWHLDHPEDETGVLGRVDWAAELAVTPFMRWLDRGVQFGFPSIEGTTAPLANFYAANVSVKRRMLERVGGFDEVEFPFRYEDTDLARRMERFGFHLLYNEEARGEHLHAVSLGAWHRTVAIVARAERRFVRRYPDAAPFFLNLFTRPPARLRWRALGARLAPIVPPTAPWLGARVWARARETYRLELARPFLEAWAKADLAELTVDRPRRPAEPEAPASDSAGG
jgi:GT2 family glycosyltransferase